MEKTKIEFSEFIAISEKIEIKIGEIISADRIPKSDKLIDMKVSFGNDIVKTCVTNLGKDFQVNDFIGLKILFLMNLVPTKMMGVVSEVMILVGVSETNEVKLDNLTLGMSLI